MNENRNGKTFQILLVLLMPMVFVFAIGNRCSNAPDPEPEAPPTGNVTFQFEYDYMTGYNVFQGGQTYAETPFSACNTDLAIAYDEDNIQPVNINWYFPILDTMMNHATIWPDGTATDFVFDAYVMGMQSAINIPANQNLDAFGVTFKVTDPAFGDIYMFSAIFVQTVQNYGGNIQALLEKVVIHELGHSRSRYNFTHSCEWNGLAWVPSPFHNDPACVMGMGRINQCNSIDLTVNPLFCPNDCEYLKKVTW